MRKAAISVMAGVLTLAGLSSGCSLSSMEKKYKDVTGKSDKNETRVELNSAGRKRLADLPGLTAGDADKIIANRPYETRRDLMKKGVLSESQFDKVRDHVYVDHAKE
jgi:DNA uptake protein ComE-like DNA-binding protein